MTEKKMYSIGEFAERTGTPIKTLHYYDEIGLLTSKKHPSSGHRQYDDNDVLTLQKIICFKFLGYSLKEIVAIIEESKLDLGLMDTLQAQRAAFVKKKEQIESALIAIDRTVALLTEKGEVDSALLMSLIRNIQTEKEQREWLEQRLSKDVIEHIFDKSEAEKYELDKGYLELLTEIKQLYGTPVDDPQVQRLVGSFLDMAIATIGSESAMLELASIELTELSELDKMIQVPLSPQEDQWIEQAFAHYLEVNPKWKEVIENGSYKTKSIE